MPSGTGMKPKRTHTRSRLCGRAKSVTTPDATALRSLVQERAKALGVTDAKQVGRLVGDVMKTHKGQVDAADVKRVAEEMLKG